MDLFKKSIPFILTVILLMPAFWPLLQSGYFPMHDDTQPTRVFQMTKALNDGQFPVRWVSDLGYGYGYPIFNFYSPLPYYFGGLLVLLGMTIITSTKIMFLAGIFISGISMYFLGRKLWGNYGGMLASIFYVYAPYHAVEIYVRGAVGEYWAYAFLPLVFIGIVNHKKNVNISELILGGIALGAVIISHNITAMITAGFLLILIITLCLQSFFKQIFSVHLKRILIVFLFGLLFSAFFWLPAITESSYVRVQSLVEGSNDFRQHFVFIDQLWNSAWGFAGSASGRTDGMSFRIGKLHLLIAVISIFLSLFIKRKFDKNNIYYLALFSIGFVLSTVLVLPFSLYFWEKVPGMGLIQYPWRFLVFISFFVSLIIGSLGTFTTITYKHQAILKIGIIMISFFTVFYYGKLFSPQFIYSFSEVDFTADDNIKWKISKISDEYLPKNFPIPQTEQQISRESKINANDIITEQADVKSHRWKFVVFAPNRAELVFSLAFFPGWKFFVDAEEVHPLIKDGLPSIILEPGRHTLTAYLGNTWVRDVGNALSMLGVGIALILLLDKFFINTIYAPK